MTEDRVTFWTMTEGRVTSGLCWLRAGLHLDYDWGQGYILDYDWGQGLLVCRLVSTTWTAILVEMRGASLSGLWRDRVTFWTMTEGRGCWSGRWCPRHGRLSWWWGGPACPGPALSPTTCPGSDQNFKLWIVKMGRKKNNTKIKMFLLFTVMRIQIRPGLN